MINYTDISAGDFFKRCHDFAYAQHLMRDLEDRKIPFVCYIYWKDEETPPTRLEKLRVPRS